MISLRSVLRRAIEAGPADARPELDSSSDTLTMRRVERKYLVEPAAQELVLGYLRHSAVPDPLYPLGVTTSVYYDTADLAAYHESVDGQVRKHKIRIRWYDEVAAGGPHQVFLEMKSKFAWQTVKYRRAITVDGAALLDGAPARVVDREELERTLVGWGFRPRLDLAPVLCIRYERHRFRALRDDLGINYDVAIAAALVLDGALHAPDVAYPVTILELKGDHLRFPGTVNGIQRFLSPWSAFSKYASGIEMCMLSGGPQALPLAVSGPRALQTHGIAEIHATARPTGLLSY